MNGPSDIAEKVTRAGLRELARHPVLIPLMNTVVSVGVCIFAVAYGGRLLAGVESAHMQTVMLIQEHQNNRVAALDRAMARLALDAPPAAKPHGRFAAGPPSADAACQGLVEAMTESDRRDNDVAREMVAAIKPVCVYAQAGIQPGPGPEQRGALQDQRAPGAGDPAAG